MREHNSILENQELHITNALSLRGKVTQADLQQEVVRIGKFVEDGGYTRTGSTVSVTYAIEQQGTSPILDVELITPLDKPFIPPQGCICKPIIKLVHAVSIRHIGNPAGLQETVNLLLAYIQKNNFQIITPAYNVSVQEATMPNMIDQMIVDVYIGVSPNIL